MLCAGALGGPRTAAQAQEEVVHGQLDFGNRSRWVQQADRDGRRFGEARVRPEQPQRLIHPRSNTQSPCGESVGCPSVWRREMETADDGSKGKSLDGTQKAKKKVNLCVNAIVVEPNAETVWPPTSYGCVRIDPKFLAK